MRVNCFVSQNVVYVFQPERKSWHPIMWPTPEFNQPEVYQKVCRSAALKSRRRFAFECAESVKIVCTKLNWVYELALNWLHNLQPTQQIPNRSCSIDLSLTPFKCGRKEKFYGARESIARSNGPRARDWKVNWLLYLFIVDDLSQ